MAFGEFQKSLNFRAPETIPNFHNMETRMKYSESVKANRAGRIDEVVDLVNEIENAEEMCKAENHIVKETKRINHCDKSKQCSF